MGSGCTGFGRSGDGSIVKRYGFSCCKVFFYSPFLSSLVVDGNLFWTYCRRLEPCGVLHALKRTARVSIY